MPLQPAPVWSIFSMSNFSVADCSQTVTYSSYLNASVGVPFRQFRELEKLKKKVQNVEFQSNYAWFPTDFSGSASLKARQFLQSKYPHSEESSRQNSILNVFKKLCFRFSKKRLKFKSFILLIFLSLSQEPNKIMTFENQTAYLPCAMQSVNPLQQPLQQDQLTLILWYYDDAPHRSSNCLKNCSLNTNEPPIYSIDFRAPDDSRGRTVTSQPNAVHFISNGRFKSRILFEFNACHSSDTPRLRNPTGSRSSGQPYPSSNHHYQQANGSLRLPFIRPICAFLKLDQVKPSDAGRYSCRLDFRRSRTLHTSLLLKVLGR